MNTLRFFFILVLASGLSLNAFARIDIKKTKRLYMPVDVSEPVLTAESSQKILPKKVNNGESSDSVIK